MQEHFKRKCSDRQAKRGKRTDERDGARDLALGDDVVTGGPDPAPALDVNESDDFDAASDGEQQRQERAAKMALNFDDKNTEDAKDILGKLHQIQLEYDGSNLKKWIKRLEIKMETYGVGSQWKKRLVIENNLPSHIQDDLNELLEKGESEAGNNIYKEVKLQLLQLHGPKEDADFRKAQKLVMTDKPSTTAKMLRDLVCKKKKPFTECCCGVAVEAMWEDTLPAQVKSHIANLSLKDDFEGTCKAADNVFETLKAGGAHVAAVSDMRFQSSAVNGASAVPTNEVAAFKPSRGGGRGRGGYRGGRARGRGAGRNRPSPPNPEDQSTWGDPHEDGPPPGACMNHYRHGKKAYFCRAKSTCPWRNLEAPPKDD